jgi:hypothetical protein
MEMILLATEDSLLIGWHRKRSHQTGSASFKARTNICFMMRLQGNTVSVKASVPRFLFHYDTL